MDEMHPVVLHIPHTSVEIPDDCRRDIVLSDDDLRREILYMTDMHTGDLYQYPGAERVEFPVSRLVLDPERFADDALETMAARGMGVIYNVTSHLEKLRDVPTPEQRRALLGRFYYPHHKRLEDACERMIAASDSEYCYIFDCHSFPSRALPYEMRDPNEDRPEICLGVDEFHAPPYMVDMAVRHFRERGYSVAINTPFAGALVPMRYYRKNPRVYAMMFEIRRDLYMNEDTGDKAQGFDRVRDDITAAIDIITRRTSINKKAGSN